MWYDSDIWYDLIVIFDRLWFFYLIWYDSDMYYDMIRYDMIRYEFVNKHVTPKNNIVFMILSCRDAMLIRFGFSLTHPETHDMGSVDELL